MQNREKLPVLFLWHHHQPFYLAPEEEIPLMPWVRLHSVRGYLDMLFVAESSQSKMCFNFSSSLIEQLEFAESKEICDKFERVSKVNLRELSEEEKKFVLTNFFSINWNVHIKTNPRYAALLAKRGEYFNDNALKSALANYTLQDYSDLIALFNLVWIGFKGRKNSSIQQLFNKGSNYNSEDIEIILSFHHQCIRDVIAGYRELQKTGRIEISSSPYAHPIIPLLCDSFVAYPDISRQELPAEAYKFPLDADKHLKKSVQKYQTAFECKHRGLWPSEGSVSAEALTLAVKNGYAWAATDQWILEKSTLVKNLTHNHFGSFDYQTEHGSLRLFFRDHALSDAIGFRYSSMPAQDAVNEFVYHLGNIESETSKVTGRCVVIALDGENPWEGYADGGEAFLLKLFSTIDSNPKLTTTTFSEQCELQPVDQIKSIHAGSWIDSNFKIWIGDPEKNQAWSELLKARRSAENLIAGDERSEKFFYWLLRAQCSDWMWWFGEPFDTPFKYHYDELFREYLKAAYRALGLSQPSELDIPISTLRRAERRLQPTYAINPQIDGRESSYFEWMGACSLDPRQFSGAMNNADRSIESLSYGFGESDLFFRIDFAKHFHLDRIVNIVLCVRSKLDHSFVIPFKKNNATLEGGLKWCYGEILEIVLPFERASIDRGQDCEFFLEIHAIDQTLERIPPQGTIKFKIPTSEMLAGNWII